MPRRFGGFGTALAVRCPLCRATFPPSVLTGRQPCPNCRVRLAPRRRYAWVISFVALTMTLLIALAIGVPRPWLFLTVMVLSRLVLIVVLFVTVRLFPMEIRRVAAALDVLGRGDGGSRSGGRPSGLSGTLRKTAFRDAWDCRTVHPMSGTRPSTVRPLTAPTT